MQIPENAKICFNQVNTKFVVNYSDCNYEMLDTFHKVLKNITVKEEFIVYGMMSYRMH